MRPQPSRNHMENDAEKVWQFDFTTVLVLLVVAVLLLIVTFEIWIPHH